MGSSSSKPDGSPPPHLWKGSGPPSVSQTLLEQLQSSAETDISRAQTLELHIQARVADELRRLEAEAAARLRKFQEELSPTDSGPGKGGDQEQQPTQGQEEGGRTAGLNRDAVAKEVAALRSRLEGRSKTRQLPEAVEAARADVVRCLRDKEKKPLDCWQEVDRFKEEVRRLERTGSTRCSRDRQGTRRPRRL